MADNEQAAAEAAVVADAAANEADGEPDQVVEAVQPAAAQEVSLTYRNNPAVTVDGHTYVKKSTVRGVTYWRCVKSHVNCRASAKSAEGSTVIEVINAAHNHEPDPVQLKAKQLVVEVRKLAAERKQTGAAVIVAEAMYALPNDVALAVDRRNLLRVANRAKRLDGSQLLLRPLPTLVFPEAFTQTATGDRFLLFDSRQHDPAEPVIFIFASPSGLEQLRHRDHWSADGTFWCTPRLFDQLYTVHANIGSSSVPAAYILMQDRRQATYKRALQALLQHGNLQGVAPTTFMHDFELAAILAIKDAWQDEGEGSEYADDAHMDNISSDNSLWATYEDSKGRPGTDPEARAAIRKEWAAGDETFKTPKTDGSGSSDTDDVSDRTQKASVKSEALSDDSLAQELKAKGSPAASPDNGPVARVGRRRKAARNLAFDKPDYEKTFEEWAFGRKKIASDPDLPLTSGLHVFKERKADNENIPKAVSLQRHKKIKVEAEDSSLPAMPAFPVGPSPSTKKSVEVIDLTLDDDIYTVDSD